MADLEAGRQAGHMASEIHIEATPFPCGSRDTNDLKKRIIMGAHGSVHGRLVASVNLSMLGVVGVVEVPTQSLMPCLKPFSEWMQISAITAIIYIYQYGQ